MKNQIVLLGILLIFSLWISGCIDKKTEVVTPSDIINRTLEKSGDVKTYKVEYISQVTTSERKTTSIWNYTVDLANKRMALHMKIITNGAVVDGWMYFFDGAHYTFDEAENRWERTPLSDREFELGWNAFERFKHIISVLEFVNATYLGVEEIDGEECYTFGWNKTKSEEKEIAQVGQTFRSKSEIETKLWIDKSYFLDRYKIYSIINTQFEKNGIIIRNETQISEDSFKFFDYNKPVNIMLPRDPKEAVEIPLPPMILRGWESMQEARQKALEELKREGSRS